MEIKNKLTVTKGDGQRGNGGKQGKGHQGTYIKDTWTNPKGVGSRVGGGEGWSWGGIVREKWRQLYLNNNLKKEKRYFS